MGRKYKEYLTRSSRGYSEQTDLEPEINIGDLLLLDHES